MEEYVTRIGDVTIQRVIPGGAGPDVEPVSVMESEDLLRAVKQEPLDDDEEEEEDLGEGDEEEEAQGVEEEDENKDEETQIRIKEEPRDEEEENDEVCNDEVENDEVDETENQQSENDEKEAKDDEEKEEGGEEDAESSKRKADSDEDSETLAKKKKMENETDADKKKVSNLRRNIREVMDEAQLDEATLAAQRQEAERLRRVQDQQKYLIEVQRQIQLNKQNSKTQNRVMSLLQGGSTSLLKTSSVVSSSNNNISCNSGPSTVLVKLGSGQQQALNRKTLEVLRGGKTVATSEPARPGITRVTPGNKPAMVTPSVSIAPVKPIIPEGQKKDSCDTDVVTISSSSDSEDDCILISEGEGEEEEEDDDVDTTNSGMHTNDLYNIPDEQGRVLINVGKPESEPEIYLAPQIGRIIKPHQIGGVRFLFDNVVESIERFNNSTGFGCILAHSMGLGKTLQVVSFCDVFLRETSAKTVMCIMPINTLQNWMAEFNLWLPTDPTVSSLAVHGEIRPRNFGIFVLNDMHKTIAARAKVVEEWNREGGVLLIGYEMYRQLSLKRPGRLRKGKKRPPDEDIEDEKNKPLLEAMHEALVRPGPDLVICDEGHRIKNSHASISHALKQIRTKRRVVLTGYPLQNNLVEYWCMVDFVRPNYLGTKTEFSNMFERPIQNGQCIDSTPQDIRLMRYRAHVLHSLLEGFVQRRSHSVLRNTLPQKEEYVILIRMTSFQRKLYDTFMNEVVRTKAVPNPLKAFAVCCKIWNHPDILYHFIKKKELDELQDLDIEETANLHTGPNSPRRPLAPKEKKGKTVKKQAQIAAVKPEVATPPQPQATTPDVKSEDRKFDFSSSQGNPTGAPPGYGEYYPPPPYQDLSYPYHRPPPPGMYYPGYYTDNQGYYPGYESGGYPGYFGNFGPYTGSKSEEFDKQSQSWGTNYGANKEKNLSKSPKDIDSSKPGYQEFYPIKEEKTEVKEEKQQFLTGFSGGQVSYNYQNYGGYGYPPQDYQSGWNKGTFPTGIGERTAPMVSSESSEQKNSFSNSNLMDSAQTLKTCQDRTHSQLKTNQSAPHGLHERNQSNQNINETHSLQSSSDQQRLSNQERLSGNQNMHATLESIQTNRMGMVVSQRTDDQQRRSSLENPPSNQQGLFANQRDQNNEAFDNLMRNRSTQEADPNRAHSNMQSVQQTSHTTHEQLQRSHHNSMYGTKNTHENEFLVRGNQERSSSSEQPLFSNIPGNKDYLSSNHNLNSRQNIPENSRIPSSQDQHLIHQQNSFQESQVCLPNPQERISGTQAMFASQEHQKNSRNLQNVHDSQHKAARSQDNLPSNQQSMFGNQRSDHSRQTNKEHISNIQQNMFENQRQGMQINNQEHIPNSQKSLFGNQRGEHNIHTNPETMPPGPQNFFANPRNDHNREVNPDNLQVNQQNMYATHGDHSLHQGNPEHLTSSHHNVSMNQRSENIETAQNFFSNQQRNEHNTQNSSEQMQQNMYAKQRAEHNLQRTSEQISTARQDLFCNPRSDGNMHGNVGGSPHSMFVNQRADHGIPISEDRGQFSHQAIIENRTDSQRRVNMGPEHLALSNQQTMFPGRNDHGSQTNQENLLLSSSGNAEKDLQHRIVSSQDQMTGNQQMFGNSRNELVTGNTDRVHRQQEGYSGNKHIHEKESKPNNQSLKNTTPQSMFAGQRIDHNTHTASEHNNQQNIAGIGERMNQDCFGSGSNRFGNQESFQGNQPSMFRGQNIHDNHHNLQTHMPQQNIYGSQLMDRGVLGNQELQGNPQTTSQQATKRSSSSNDHISVPQQQESYINQGNDHSTQKIKKTDNQLDNQQMVRSAQECSQSQFNIFPAADGHYRTCNDQEVSQRTRTNVADSREHIHSRERHQGNPSHNIQDQKQSSQNLFGNQNVHDSQRWLHNRQDFTGTQPNLFESHGTHPRDNPFQINQNMMGNKNLTENQQKFHSIQERAVSQSQQNFFPSQSNQTGIQRQEHMGGKQQHIQENQYLQGVRMQEHQQNATVERQGQESLHGSSQSAMGRKNIPEHLSDLQSPQAMASSPGMYGNQVHRNLQGEIHGNQEHILTHHSTIGNIMTGKHGNQEYGHNNQCGTGNFQNIPGSNLASIHQQAGHNNQTHSLPASQHGSTLHNQEMRKGNQNVTPSQSYGMQNVPQMLSGHESHPGNQSGIPSGQQNMISNQNLSRPQHGAIKAKEAQQESTNEKISSNQQSSYGNQFHMQKSQQPVQGISNSHHHMQGSQHNMPTGSANTQMFSNQHMMQGNVQVAGGGSQGLHGSQTSQQHMMSGTSPLLHNKELSQGKQGANNTPNFSGSHAQYMLSASQQNVSVGPHSIHAANQAIPNNKAEQQKTQENSQQKIKSNPALSVNQQGTQTGPDNSSLMAGAQHRVQNMLVQPTHQQTQNSFDSTIIMSSKAMSGGQVIHGNQQHKQEMKNNQFNPEDQSRFKGQFDEQFMNDRFQGNYSKPGFMGQDFQFPYQNQFPYKENQFNDQPGPSGQQFRKDDNCEEGHQKDADKNYREGEESAKTMSTSSTNTDKEEDRDKKDKKDDDDKIEKKEGTSKSSKEDPGIPYDWATELLKGYVPGDIQSSAKMAVFFCILEESIVLGDRILLFSQSLFTLNLMEELLQQQLVPGKEEERWARNVNYYRLDGSTTAMEREKLINEFNSNSNLHLFLVSTRAGSLGINLVGANRVIVFDASWNPCHDTQAVCRVYRYGQKKPCFVYRLVTDNCLEKKIYDRQINKQGMSDRVVDECNPDAHLSIKEVTSLCWDDKTDDESPKDFSNLQDSYIDVVLQKVIQNHSSFLSKEPFQHESLLVDRKEKKLSQAEKRLAKRSYELEKQATTRPVYNGVQPNQARPKPMASVRPMQAEMGNTRQRGWIPASVWQRQGMSAQEMTLPLDVVIPTNAADRASIVLKAGQKVMVLKSPKGIYMQLENGKIIAIRTAFKVGANKKPGEQQGKGTEMSRRGGRQQVISTRGRPVRAVGPVSRPPPVTVTVTRKRPPEEEPPAVRSEEDTLSTGQPPTVPVTPMEVSSAENDVPNPFTAAAAASLSTMQLPQQQNSPSPVSQQTQPSTPQSQPQPVPSIQESQNQQPVQHTEQQMLPQTQHHQPLPSARYQQQPIQQSQHQQQSLLQSQHLQHQIQQPNLPQSPSIPQQQLSQHPQQHSHLSQQLPQTQLQQQPIVQPQHTHQHISHPQLVQHQHSQSQLPTQQLHQPIAHHPLPSQPIPPHSQIPPHPQQPMPHSSLLPQSITLSQIPQHHMTHPQHSHQTHLHQSQLSMHPMSHPPMQSHPIPPHSQMHQSISHLQIPQQPLPLQQFPQQPMIHPQAQHPQHYEPPPIPPLVGDQLT